MAVPQILALWKSKSAEGVSKGMVGIWLVSDTYKTIYFIMKVLVQLLRNNLYSLLLLALAKPCLMSS